VLSAGVSGRLGGNAGASLRRLNTGSFSEPWVAKESCKLQETFKNFNFVGACVDDSRVLQYTTLNVKVAAPLSHLPFQG
jgi:hypothetical protein